MFPTDIIEYRVYIGSAEYESYSSLPEAIEQVKKHPNNTRYVNVHIKFETGCISAPLFKVTKDNHFVPNNILYLNKALKHENMLLIGTNFLLRRAA